MYKKFQTLSFVATGAYFVFCRVLPWLKKETRPCRYHPDFLIFTEPDKRANKRIKETKIAFICDEMTYQDFKTNVRQCI